MARTPTPHDDTTPLHALLHAALAYAARGWCVLPLHDVTQGHCSCAKGATCDKPGKHPRIDTWPETASRDPAQIRDWWQQWPGANVGLLTGHRSHLAVLDVDPRNGGDVALSDLEQCYAPLPETPLVLTGGQGRHYYFRLDGPLGKFDPAPGLNVQADGAQVVAPPSRHQSGTLYAWEASSDPDDVPLAPLPDWLTALAHDHAAALSEQVQLPDVLPAVDVTTLQVPTRIKFLICTGTDPNDRQRYPSRSEALFAVLTGLVRAGYGDATIAAVALDRRYAISEKVWSQKNPKSPTYEAQTRQWLAGDIGRARAYVARHSTDQETPEPPESPDDPAEVEDLLARAQADAEQRGNGHTPGPEPAPLAQAVLSFEALRTLRLPPLARYLDWLEERAIIMLYGPRGVGKSLALLGIALSLTTGTKFLAWETHTPVGVLLVDGEMALEDLQTRAAALAGGQTPCCLSFLSSDYVFRTTGSALTLAGVEKRQAIEAILDGHPAVKVLILDNVSCLFPGLDENAKKDWEPVNQWLIRLRHRGVSVLFGHHAGKGGEQRGTSGREDALNLVIKLMLPPGHQATDGCHFYWKFTKTRSLKGVVLEDLDVRLDEVGGHPTWTYSTLEATRTKQVQVLLEDGVPAKVIADELGVSASYVYRQKKYLGL
jgi:hypothetical protein